MYDESSPLWHRYLTNQLLKVSISEFCIWKRSVIENYIWEVSPAELGLCEITPSKPSPSKVSIVEFRTPTSQSEQFYVSIRKQGVDSKLVVYQNEHHNIGDPDRAIHRLTKLRDWFAQYDPKGDD